jgi:dUTP pyrophosphatase
MSIKIVLDPGAVKPTRAHGGDVGYDLYSPVNKTIYPKWKHGVDNMVTIDTGVHVQLPKNIQGLVCPKSGLMFNHDITAGIGTVDPDYTGSIRVKLYNMGNTVYHIEKGQKIAQLVLEQVITPELDVVEDLEETERGAGGFGSTGKF